MIRACANCYHEKKPREGYPCNVCESNSLWISPADVKGGEKQANDPVEHPKHYCNGKIECIDAIESAVTGLTGFEGMLTGNAIKYLFRWKAKNGIEDLKKARWYLDKLIKVIEK